MIPKRKIGVLIGPTIPGDTSALDSIFDNARFEEVTREQCNILPISSNLPFIAVEVPSFGASKILSEYSQVKQQHKNKILKITMTSISDTLDQSLQHFWNQIPNYVNNDLVDLSELKLKLPRSMTINFAPNISTALFMISVYCDQNDLHPAKFNFSNSDIPKLDGFRLFNYFFDSVQTINLSGNLFDEATFYEQDKDYLFPGIQVITDNPEINIKPVKNFTLNYPQFDFSRQEKQPQVIPPHPIFVIKSNPQPPPVTLDDFPIVTLDITQFPTNRFICQLFNKLWNPIDDLSSFYYQNAVFSITAKASYHFCEFFHYVNQNLVNDIFEDKNRFVGIEKIKETMNFYFPNGFKARPARVNSSQLYNGMFAVIVHGVFENGGVVFGFDRSLVLVDMNHNFFVANDHILIHEPPQIM